jgi:DNA-binding transcriptional MerR regulator
MAGMGPSTQPRLNSILALKELGLTLEQIGPLVENEISPEELRGMLIMKRAQVEQSLSAEETRLRHIGAKRCRGREVRPRDWLLPDTAIERERARFWQLHAARERTSGRADDGDHRQVRDQCREPFIFRSHRHLD